MNLIYSFITFWLYSTVLNSGTNVVTPCSSLLSIWVTRHVCKTVKTEERGVVWEMSYLA